MSDRIRKMSVDLQELESELRAAKQDAALLSGALQLLLDNDIMPSSGELLAACGKAKALQQFKGSHAQLGEWRSAVEEECAKCGTAFYPDDPKRTLDTLLEWSDSVALDPNLSQRAAALRDTWKPAAQALTLDLTEDPN